MRSRLVHNVVRFEGKTIKSQTLFSTYTKMTTPLFWKSLEISNKFFMLVLRYPPPLFWDPSQEHAVVRRTKTIIIPFFIYITLMILTLYVALSVIYDALQTNSCNLHASVLLSETFEAVIMSLCITLILILYPNLNLAIEQFYNSLLKYERLARGRECFNVANLSVMQVLKAGE